SFTLASVAMKLRAEIDARRDVALGIAKDSHAIPKELRLHILRKDVFERVVAIVLLLMASGAIVTAAAVYILVRVKSIDILSRGFWECSGLAASSGALS